MTPLCRGTSHPSDNIAAILAAPEAAQVSGKQVIEAIPL
jgi:2-methylcitrate dehydratase PrpD